MLYSELKKITFINNDFLNHIVDEYNKNVTMNI